VDINSMVAELDRQLAEDDAARAARYPGDRGGRQPVHTVYVPADRVVAGIAQSWGSQALDALDTVAPDRATLAEFAGVEFAEVDALVEKVRHKLRTEPIEDLRVDLEDGYIPVSVDKNAAEDAAVQSAINALKGQSVIPFLGVRVKSFEPATRERAVRSLVPFVEAMLPGNFVVTLPKVTSVAQVRAMVWCAGRLEAEYGLEQGILTFELQVETTQAVQDAEGRATVSAMVHAAQGRCTGLHYGTYDYSAACGIAAAYQSMEHPVADHAKNVMLLAAAGTGVRLSDGSTNILPVGGAMEITEGWRLHARLVRRSLERGFYQGWDMHPHQLPTRYLATYGFFRAALPRAAARLRSYLDSASYTTVMDEPATARALANVLVRGLDCGALDETEVAEAAGIDRESLTALR
jgi:citrate lyase beta subunit